MDYDAHPKWPLINTYPDYIQEDPTAVVDREEFGKHCPPFTVLFDFWKFWAMQLAVENRHDFWKLDLNSEGWLARNFIPHGAPALFKDDKGESDLLFRMATNYKEMGETQSQEEARQLRLGCSETENTSWQASEGL